MSDYSRFVATVEDVRITTVEQIREAAVRDSISENELLDLDSESSASDDEEV